MNDPLWLNLNLVTTNQNFLNKMIQVKGNHLYLQLC